MGCCQEMARLECPEWRQPIFGIEPRERSRCRRRMNMLSLRRARGALRVLTGVGPRQDDSYIQAVDLAPVALIARVPEVLVVNAALPVHSVADIARLAEATPGGLHFGSAGPGTSQHLGGEMLKTALGVELTHVPYKGMQPAISDVARRPYPDDVQP